jgi:hypothetical protein
LKLATAPALARTRAPERGAAPGRVATCRAPLRRCTVSWGLRGGPALPRALRPTPGPLRRAQARLRALVAGPSSHTSSHAPAAHVARMHAGLAGQAAHLATPASKRTHAKQSRSAVVAVLQLPPGVKTAAVAKSFSKPSVASIELLLLP